MITSPTCRNCRVVLCVEKTKRYYSRHQPNIQKCRNKERRSIPFNWPPTLNAIQPFAGRATPFSSHDTLYRATVSSLRRRSANIHHTAWCMTFSHVTPSPGFATHTYCSLTGFRFVLILRMLRFYAYHCSTISAHKRWGERKQMALVPFGTLHHFRRDNWGCNKCFTPHFLAWCQKQNN